ncbi:16135_t:CDS:2 [Funneliformis caledonium]|uniref:16135_t:CDS:1 n=1 Tax=Funneliformis caledonium TaxID=1117310 RepID=A0A9N9DJN5_9GLOM|nr:16135_t:CDS:2 [Funneliformis caledonium]
MNNKNFPRRINEYQESEKLINNIEKLNESINGLKEAFDSKNNEDKVIEGIKNLGNRLEFKITSLGQETEACKTLKTQLKETQLQLETTRNHLTKEADNHRETKERLATTQCNLEETNFKLETIYNHLTKEADNHRETKEQLEIIRNNLTEEAELANNDREETKRQLETIRKNFIEEQLATTKSNLDNAHKDREETKRQLETIRNNLSEEVVRHIEIGEQLEHLNEIDLANKDHEETKRHLTEETGKHLETKKQLTILQAKLDRVNIVQEVLNLLKNGKSKYGSSATRVIDETIKVWDDSEISISEKIIRAESFKNSLYLADWQKIEPLLLQLKSIDVCGTD